MELELTTIEGSAPLPPLVGTERETCTEGKAWDAGAYMPTAPLPPSTNALGRANEHAECEKRRAGGTRDDNDSPFESHKVTPQLLLESTTFGESKAPMPGTPAWAVARTEGVAWDAGANMPCGGERENGEGRHTAVLVELAQRLPRTSSGLPLDTEGRAWGARADVPGCAARKTWMVRSSCSSGGERDAS